MKAYHSPVETTHGTSNRFYLLESLGIWLGGIGIACLLRSPSFLFINTILSLIIVLMSNSPDDPTFFSWFARVVLLRINKIPRWTLLLVVLAGTAVGWPLLSFDQQTPPAATVPAIVVQVRCKPGTSYLWKADFEKHIKPAIEEVIANGKTFTGLQVIQSTLPWQPFDFMLIYTGKIFASFDKPGVAPHFAALFQREGSVRAMSVLNEMNSYEEQSIVTLVYLNQTR